MQRRVKVPGLEPSMIPSVVLESVVKVFRQGGFWPLRSRTPETHAVKGLSLTVPAGAVLGLLGPNGSGKSTTLKLISTTLLPDRGRVVVQGFDTRGAGRDVRRCVGLALASERSFFPRLTVRENLEFFAALENVPRQEMRERIHGTLAAVDLANVADKQAIKLSSGMYQRLGIARALIKEPSVLLLDEPTRSLDAAATRETWKLIHKIATQGTTTLLATHNFEEAAAVCDRIAVLYRGELIGERAIGSLRAEDLRELYIASTDERAESALELGVPA